MTTSALRTDERGFTLVEVLVAAAVLLVGMLGLAAMLDQASQATASTKSREQAVSLQREIVETARALAYDQLTPNSVVGRVQGAPGAGLSDAGADAGWTIRRRDVTYQVTLGVCSVDDPADGTGVHDAATFCATGAGVTTAAQCRALLGRDGSVQGTAGAATGGAAVGDCGIDLNLDGTVDNLTIADAPCQGAACGGAGTDANPDDYKRIVSLVRWTRGTGQRYAIQSATVANPGLSSAPQVTELTTTAADPITAGTGASFSLETSRPPATVAWYVDGTHSGVASGSGTDWNFGWNLGTVSSGTKPNGGEVLDGSYVVSAKAFDAYGAYGGSRAVTLRVNRRAPYPPQELEGGRQGNVAEFEWAPNAERDIVGYRVYRDQGAEDALVCALQEETRCRDKEPPGIPAIDYYVVAVDRATDGSLREGQPSAPVTVRMDNTPPAPPPSLVASTSGGNTILVWQASPGDPDPGDVVDHYRIYRDGVAYADRYDRTGTGAELSFVDTKTNGVPHQYWVAAVDTNLGQSTLLGPVSK